MLVLKDLQLRLLCTIEHILDPFQVLRVSFRHKLWLCNISVHITSFAYYILLLMGILLNKLISSRIDKVDLDPG